LEDLQHKYETLYHCLKNEILNGNFQYGDKIPTENDLAAKFSLSRFTVRRAIDILANEGFLEKRHGSGTYVKATNPNRDRAGIIGIITTYLDDYIFPSIIRGIESVLTLHGFSLNLGITENKLGKETACLRVMLSQNIDGLIIEGTKSALINPNIGLLETFRARGIPVVFINGNYSDYDSSYILMDDEMSGQMVAQYLIDNGHRKIGGIFKSDDIQGHRRYRGMEKAMQLSGISVEENSLLWYTTENLEQIFRTEYDHLLLNRFKDCTALICYNDQIALRVIRTFERNGVKIPEDISVIGFDNSELCEVSPVKLTSVTHARSAMGEAAANMLLELLAQKDLSSAIKKQYLPSVMVHRNSVRNLLMPNK
jgi:GntR family transcriptional regulator of arabinose operon